MSISIKKNSKSVLPTHICGRRRNWGRMGFKISEKFKECLGNALSAIIRVFLYFVIFEEKVNAVVYILATFKFWQNLQKKMINLAWSHLKWMQMYLQRMIYKRAPLFQGAAAPTQREREPFCQSLLWHDWFVQAWLLLGVILQKMVIDIRDEIDKRQW